MGPKIISYRDLVVWQQAMELADLVYRITDKFPTQERFGLVSQMRRAAVSVPSNIAEGSRHRTPGYISRIVIALGEHAELET
jgi:four helix bundle protein